MADVPTILSWTGGWGLPSLDPTCLQALAYTKFAGFPVKVTVCDNPFRSPTGNLPVLQLPGDKFCGCDDILEHLKSAGHNTDEQLTEKQKIDTAALCCYIDDMLRPAVLYMIWLNNQNYTQFTRPWYTKQLKFPYNYFIPGKFCTYCQNFVAHKLDIDEDDVICDETEEKLSKRATLCFETLTKLLGDQEYFFGESPTTLDSKVLAYLAIILKAPLPKNKLKCQLLEHPKLEQFCDRILHLYFPSVVQEHTPKSQANSQAEEDSRTTKINAVLSVGFAVVAMVFYALSSGLVSIEIVDHADHARSSSTEDKQDADS